MPPKREKKGKKGGEDGKKAPAAPPSKKEKAAQMKKLFDASFNGDLGGVLEILALWQDLTVATQLRYLDTVDPEGDTPYKLSLRGRNIAETRDHDQPRAQRCAYIAELLLCGSHQNIGCALKMHAWQVRSISLGARLGAKMSSLLVMRLPHLNTPLFLTLYL